jgi:FeS assembly SUF system protein
MTDESSIAPLQASPSPDPPLESAQRQPLEIPASVEVGDASSDAPSEFVQKLIAAMKTVYDPEIPVDVFELGLIYKIDVADNRDVGVEMTLTAPACPIAGEMPLMVEAALKTVEGVGTVTVTMTFDPPWTPERMSEEARLALNMF